ncbi:Metallo-dependent phosphatase-like protein [Mycena leptocephala]|nr:Metallo-dependent phosphatase-like protein [Mycena leptocephala]
MQSILLALAFASHVAGDGHVHDHAKREFPSAKLTLPSRPLTWGSLNILHTTDSHGWLLGHQKTSFPEPNYSGDFGDFASFVSHMKELAIKKNIDLLLVDSGDLHDGTGLSNGYPVGGVDAQQSNEFFKQLPYDVLAIGNHELYNTLDMHDNFAPCFKGRYLSSNVNIPINGVSKPVGSRFAKFKTRKGRAVTALGVLFDFKGNAANTTVRRSEIWSKRLGCFVDAIKDEPDFFRLAGHMPVARDNCELAACFQRHSRRVPSDAHFDPRGHTHIRDCLQLDGRSMSLESGRYMETIGAAKNITFSRRYLDPNRVTFEYHTRRGNFSFDTTQGRSITKGLEQLAKEFDLSLTYGTAPHDFTIYQAPYPANNSLLSLMAEVMPVAPTVNNTRASIPNIMITNSGSLRFDIYAGPFTKNNQLTVLSYADPFLYIPNVPFSVANGVLPALNGAGMNHRKSDEAVEAELWTRGYVGTRYREWMEDMARRNAEVDGQARFALAKLTPGYVTTDACPGVGDDTPHAPLEFHSLPNFIASAAPIGLAVDAPIDLVFVDFLEKQLIGILNGLQKDKVYTTVESGRVKYTNVLATEALGIYAQQSGIEVFKINGTTQKIK